MTVGSWVERVWAAQGKGWLTNEEAWEVMLEARHAPDPGQVVDTVLRGLAAAYQPLPAEPPDIDPVVIMDLPEAQAEEG